MYKYNCLIESKDSEHHFSFSSPRIMSKKRPRVSSTSKYALSQSLDRKLADLSNGNATTYSSTPVSENKDRSFSLQHASLDDEMADSTSDGNDEVFEYNGPIPEIEGI
jgi:hypothetical protein